MVEPKNIDVNPNPGSSSVPGVPPIVKGDTPPAGGAKPVPSGPVVSPVSPTPAEPKPGVSPKPAEPRSGELQMVPLAALQEERTARQNLQAEIEALKQVVQQPQPQQQMPQQQVPQPQLQEQLDKLWEEDPRKAVQAEIMVAFNWRDQMDASVDYEVSNLRHKYVDFTQWEDSARHYVRSLPLDQRAKPGVMELAYYIVRGQNVDKIIQQQKDQMYQQFQQNPAQFQTPYGTTPQPTVPTGTVQLSEEQRAAAYAMGISDEDYVMSMKQGGQ